MELQFSSPQRKRTANNWNSVGKGHHLSRDVHISPEGTTPIQCLLGQKHLEAVVFDVASGKGLHPRDHGLLSLLPEVAEQQI